MPHLVDLASAPLPIPSILFFSGLGLWVVFSVLVRQGLALYGYDPLEIAGVSWAQRNKIRNSISKRRLPDNPSLHALAIEWSEYEVAVGRRWILQGVLGTLAVELVLCVAYDFDAIPVLLIVTAILQALLFFLQVSGTVTQIRRLPLCEQLARDREFETSSTTTPQKVLGDSTS
jgi:hypothetical protein